MGTVAQKDTLTFNAWSNIDANRLLDILCNAFDGGISYWCPRYELEIPDGFSVSDLTWLDKPSDWEEVRKVYLIPFTDDGKVILYDSEQYEDEEDVTYVLDKAAIQRGCEIMPKKYPRHWQDLVTENDDAITADVFVQCCVLGEIVYG